MGSRIYLITGDQPYIEVDSGKAEQCNSAPSSVSHVISQRTSDQSAVDQVNRRASFAIAARIDGRQIDANKRDCDWISITFSNLLLASLFITKEANHHRFVDYNEDDIVAVEVKGLAMLAV